MIVPIHLILIPILAIALVLSIIFTREPYSEIEELENGIRAANEMNDVMEVANRYNDKKLV